VEQAFVEERRIRALEPSLKIEWGAKSGSRAYFEERDSRIKQKYEKLKKKRLSDTECFELIIKKMNLPISAESIRLIVKAKMNGRNEP
jgi:hypothetical protein